MSENKITEVALTEEAFISFKDDERNATLVSDGKYGIHEFINDEIITKTITIDEISNYKFFPLPDSFFETPHYLELNTTYYGYPFVTLK